MIENKGLGGKRINPMKLSFTNSELIKIHKLGTSCNMKPAKLLHLIITRCLDDSLFVDGLQNEFNVNSEYKIYLVNKGGLIEYVIRGRFNELG